MSYKSVPEECPTRVSRVSHKSVPQESHKSKSVPQECPTRVSQKSVPQECPTRVSFGHTSFSNVFAFGFVGSILFCASWQAQYFVDLEVQYFVDVVRGRCSTLWMLKCIFRGRCRTLALECRFRGRRSTLWTVKCRFRGRC